MSKTSVITKANETCLLGQLKKNEQNEVLSKVLSFEDKIAGEPLVEDIETGYELFHVVVFCSPMVFKTYSMIEQLLSFETTRAIILAIVKLFHSGAIKAEVTFYQRWLSSVRGGTTLVCGENWQDARDPDLFPLL